MVSANVAGSLGRSAGDGLDRGPDGADLDVRHECGRVAVPGVLAGADLAVRGVGVLRGRSVQLVVVAVFFRDGRVGVVSVRRARGVVLESDVGRVRGAEGSRPQETGQGHEGHGRAQGPAH